MQLLFGLQQRLGLSRCGPLEPYAFFSGMASALFGGETRLRSAFRFEVRSRTFTFRLRFCPLCGFPRLKRPHGLFGNAAAILGVSGKIRRGGGLRLDQAAGLQLGTQPRVG